MDPISPGFKSSNLNTKSFFSLVGEGHSTSRWTHILINCFCVTMFFTPTPHPLELLELIEKIIHINYFGDIFKMADSHIQVSHFRSEQIVLKSNTVKLSGTSIHQLPRYIIYIINLSYLAPIWQPQFERTEWKWVLSIQLQRGTTFIMYNTLTDCSDCGDPAGNWHLVTLLQF